MVLEKWPNPGRRIASINSFGYGGTNAHCIIESSEPYQDEEALVTCSEKPGYALTGEMAGQSGGNVSVIAAANISHSTRISSNVGTVDGSLQSSGGSDSAASPQLFVISARTKLSLQVSLENLKRWISTPGRRLDFSNIAHTLCTRRSAMLWRRSIVASDPEKLASGLGQRSLSFEKSYNQIQTVFLFTGQGAQWHAMGREVRLHPFLRRC
jgi:acyl transferase domain-containing protein